MSDSTLPAKKKTTNELLAEREEIYREIWENGGEISEEMELKIFSNLVAIQNKADAIQHAMRALEAEEEFLKAQASLYADAAKARQNSALRIKERIKSLMLANGVDSIRGSSVEFYVSKSQQALKISECPAEYEMIVTEKVPDKERIKADLKSGKEIKGCHLIQNYALRTRVVASGS